MESIAQSRRAWSSSFSIHHILQRDRFSVLPSEIAHHILSFLHISDLTRVGILSKHCRGLYLSSPTLNFTSFPSDSTRTFNNRLHLIGSLDRFFLDRPQYKVQSFSLHWVSEFQAGDTEIQSTSHLEKIWVFDWIEKAVSCNVENLDFCFLSGVPIQDFIEETQIEFPSSLFPSKSLRSLRLVMNSATLKTPPFTFSSNLKQLELSRVHIKDDEGFFKWISCSCKCIEKLSLRQVSGIETMNIKILSLKKFRFFAVNMMDRCHIDITAEKIEDILIAYRFESPSNQFFNIHAPNLKSIQWVGNLMNHTNLGKLEFLNNAVLSLDPEDDLDSGFEVLCSLCRAKYLVLNEVAMKAASREGCRQAPLFDACLLSLTIGNFDDELVPAMVSLFRRMNDLFDLTIKADPMHDLFDLTIEADAPVDDPRSDTFGFNVQWWKLQKLAFISKLKQVTIGLCHGSNGMELAKYVLECAKNLQKMVIIYLPQDLEKVVIQVKECKKISKPEVFIMDKKTSERKRVRISEP